VEKQVAEVMGEIDNELDEGEDHSTLLSYTNQGEQKGE